MLARSTSSLVALLFSCFSSILIALATGGPAPRELSVREKQALRGGDTFQDKCCQAITACMTLPNYNDCSWFTTNGVYTCKKGFAAQYNYNGNNMSCTGPSPGTLCTLGNTAACIITQGCTWNYQTGTCVTFGDWEGYEPGYDSCDPNCS
jgi:hypothetical protein